MLLIRTRFECSKFILCHPSQLSLGILTIDSSPVLLEPHLVGLTGPLYTVGKGRWFYPVVMTHGLKTSQRQRSLSNEILKLFSEKLRNADHGQVK
jgi:hypothetical protein